MFILGTINEYSKPLITMICIRVKERFIPINWGIVRMSLSPLIIIALSLNSPVANIPIVSSASKFLKTLLG